MSDIRKRCVDIFAKVMEVDSATINVDTNPGNLSQWDSLSHVQLLVGLEREFSIEINPEEGMDLESFNLVYEFVKEKLS
ncbi:MAG: acyl carrier protein [Deltaproteobacteria bacterium]|nr:acyl carrier protein [Deltaproteobacteria bacterium]